MVVSYGLQARFLTLLSRDFGSVPYQPGALTARLVRRLTKTGSLLDAEGDDDDDCEGRGSEFDQQPTRTSEISEELQALCSAFGNCHAMEGKHDGDRTKHRIGVPVIPPLQEFLDAGEKW
jgi:hypothetical protein